jgi:hypothetical protein
MDQRTFLVLGVLSFVLQLRNDHCTFIAARQQCLVQGEFVECMPDPTTFTDAQLGIPPDDAADPEYWGAHFDKWDKKLH